MEQEEQKDFALFLSEKIRGKSMNPKKLAELSGIPEAHIEALVAGKFEVLPPAPYLRGYLIRLGGVLDFNGEEWWTYLKEEGMLMGSGAEDLLPVNRFAKKKIPKFIWIIVVLVIGGVYFGIRSAAILGTPTLIVTTPNATSATSTINQFSFQGQVQDANSVTLNGESVPIDANGYFSKLILLEPGLNSVEVAAKKFLGREVRAVYQIVYEPPLASSSTEQEKDKEETPEDSL